MAHKNSPDSLFSFEHPRLSFFFLNIVFIPNQTLFTAIADPKTYQNMFYPFNSDMYK